MNKFERIEELKKQFDKGLIPQYELDKEILKAQNEEKMTSPIPGYKASGIKKFKKVSRKDIWYASILAIVLLTAAYLLTDGFRLIKTETGLKRTLPVVNVYFEEEEVFPVYLIYLRNSKQGLMELTITNPDNISKTVQIVYGFTKYGRYENKTVHIEPGSVQKIPITPYSSKFRDVVNPINATLVVKVTDEQNTTLFSELWTIKVNPFDEVPWKIKNRDCSNLIASWITPRNRFVQEITRKAIEKSGGHITSAADLNDQDFKNLVKNIFNTVKDESILYTKSTISFDEGSAQRIRLPYLTLKSKSANSIDASVLLASLFENVGLRSYIVILSEHAIVGVARPNHENDKIFIDTSLMNRSTIESILSLESAFAAATKSGKEAYNKGYSSSVGSGRGKFIVIDVYKARQDGVLPIN